MSPKTAVCQVPAELSVVDPAWKMSFLACVLLRSDQAPSPAQKEGSEESESGLNEAPESTSHPVCARVLAPL